MNPVKAVLSKLDDTFPVMGRRRKKSNMANVCKYLMRGEASCREHCASFGRTTTPTGSLRNYVFEDGSSAHFSGDAR